MENVDKLCETNCKNNSNITQEQAETIIDNIGERIILNNEILGSIIENSLLSFDFILLI